MTRIAACACGQVQVTVAEEPLTVVACHCDFCQRRTGSPLQVSAVFSADQNVEVSGETKIYNGLALKGVGTANGDDVSYHFCPTCGATVYWTFEGRPILAVAVGSFADPDFPAPSSELHTPFRHHWMRPIGGAEQFERFRPG
jgi:hypothetical protein